MFPYPKTSIIIDMLFCNHFKRQSYNYKLSLSIYLWSSFQSCFKQHYYTFDFFKDVFKDLLLLFFLKKLTLLHRKRLCSQQFETYCQSSQELLIRLRWKCCSWLQWQFQFKARFRAWQRKDKIQQRQHFFSSKRLDDVGSSRPCYFSQVFQSKVDSSRQ